MFVRLWWKDARQFWPIWIFLALAAVTIQGLLLHYVGYDARQGALGLIALACASLHALAVGAAAFAGEREMGTLAMLDILPVDRRVVWVGKASFAAVTTLALALVLMAMAAVSTDRWDSQGLRWVWQALGFGLFVLVALGWALFWSAILDNALTAAVAATCSAGLGLMVMLASDVLSGRSGPKVFPWFWQILLIASTTIASRLIFARKTRPRKVRSELRSPSVVTRAAAVAPGRVRLWLQSPVTRVLLTVPRPRLEAPEESLIGQSPRRSWVAEARLLAWQTVQEGWRSWCLLVVIGLVFPASVVLYWRPGGAWWIVAINAGVGLIAGANVFGLENRARTYRFLNHHGVRPRLVWLVKLAVWSAGLALIWVPQYTFAARVPGRLLRFIENWLEFWSTPLLFFAIAQLAGMVIRRGITAMVVSVVLGLALAVPQIEAIIQHILPAEGLLVVPAMLLVVSWAWSGDWLFDRPAPGRWLRLGLLLLSASILIAGWYAGYRAWSVPDLGPITPPAAWTEAMASPLPVAQNAAELYFDAGRRLADPDTAPRNGAVLDLLRRAAVRADCRFPRPAKPTLVDHVDLPPAHELAQLVRRDIDERQQRGDLAGAWDDIVVLLRMARHFSEPAGLSQYMYGASMERDAIGQALEWAVERGQTPERLLAALAAYRALPKIPSPSDAWRAEANLVENTLDLPASTIRNWLDESMPGPRSQQLLTSALIDGVTCPWERTRARRVNRLVARLALDDAAREPWQWPRQLHNEASRALESTPLAKMLLTDRRLYVDLNEVGRRALVQVLALRVWQLRHGGRFPDRLDQLVPELLPGLPRDPFSGGPFVYIQSSGQVVAPLREALFPSWDTVLRSAKGSRLLYSVGPDGVDHDGQAADIVFAIPPVEDAGGASQGQGETRAKGQQATSR